MHSNNPASSSQKDDIKYLGERKKHCNMAKIRQVALRI